LPCGRRPRTDHRTTEPARGRGRGRGRARAGVGGRGRGRARARVRARVRARARSLFRHRTDAVHPVGRALEGGALLTLAEAGHARARGLVRARGRVRVGGRIGGEG
jgi:hypothetical protein